MLPDDMTLTPPRAAELVPSLRGRGGHAHPQTIIRWIAIGVKVGDARVRLAGKKVGGCWLTSRAAITEFLAAINAGRDAAVPERTPAERARASAAADRELAAAGW